MHMSFHGREPFISAGLGTVEAGPPEVFPVALGSIRKQQSSMCDE